VFAWAGAALFVVSLLYFLFSYMVTFARPVPATPPGALAGDIALFSLFALHHSLFARTRVRTAVMRLVPAHLERAFYVWIASLLFLAVCVWWRPVAGVLWDVSGAALGVLWLLQGVAAWLTLRSAAVIGVLELAGVRESKSTGFKTVGPYGWVRHPIYTGWLLLVFATSPMTMTRLVFAIVSSAYLLLAIPFEERSLLATSNGGYQRYRQQVRWKLLPGLY
jgi:methanethiol S-methyltransferase